MCMIVLRLFYLQKLCSPNNIFHQLPTEGRGEREGKERLFHILRNLVPIVSIAT